jgi:hypothetical protein
MIVRFLGFRFGPIIITFIRVLEIFFVVFEFRDGFRWRIGLALVVVLIPFEVDATGPVEGVLEPGEVADEGLQAGRALTRIFKALQGGEGLADFKEEDAAHGLVGVATFAFFEGGFLFGEAIVPFEALLDLEPILVAGVSPFGEVLVVDGFSLEEFGEDAFGFREFVEPGENGFAEFAVVEAAVELFADGGGEAGDFTESGGHRYVSFGV